MFFLHAHNRAPRRMHTTKHLEGCEQKHLEGCTSQNIAKVKLSHQNIHDYNESRPDQHKYSSTLHPGRARLKASQLINTTALFTSCIMGTFTDQASKASKTNSYRLISRLEPPTNHRRHAPKETCEPRTSDCPPKVDQESTPAQEEKA